MFKVTSILNTRELVAKTSIRRLSMSSENYILFNRINGVGQVILNRPKQFNALTCSMEKSLASKLKEFSEDTDIQIILVKGAGNKAFSAGGDLKDLADASKSSAIFDFFKTEYQLITKFPA